MDRRTSVMGLALLLGACGDPAPRMPVQDVAFSIVQAEFSRVLQEGSLSEPDVRWWTDTCPGTDQTAVVLGRKCYSGIYYRAAGVDVAWRESFGHSAYSHELMHYFLDRLGKGSDPLHAQAEYWEAVWRADTQLQALGL